MLGEGAVVFKDAFMFSNLFIVEPYFCCTVKDTNSMLVRVVAVFTGYLKLLIKKKTNIFRLLLRYLNTKYLITY